MRIETIQCWDKLIGQSKEIKQNRKDIFDICFFVMFICYKVLFLEIRPNKFEISLLFPSS